MPLSLQDVLSAPSDPDELNRHLITNGIIPAPEPPPEPKSLVSPATVAQMTPPAKTGHVTTDEELASEYQPGTGLGTQIRKENTFLNAQNKPNLVPLSAVKTGSVGPSEVPSIGGGGAPVGAISGLAAPNAQPARPTEKESIAAGIAQHGGTEKEEGKRQFAELRPVISAQPGSAEYYQQKLNQEEFDKTHPWGGDISAKPGLGGKILHGLAKAGNIAGDILAPAVMANIPGTELNRNEQEAATARQLKGARQEESTLATQDLSRREGEAKLQKELAANDQELVKDQSGAVTGWKDKTGALHGLDEEGTPQAVKDIAEASKSKTEGPRIEKAQNGDIVQITTDKDGNATSKVVYKADPKVETDLTSRTVGGKEHHILINKKTGEDIKDLGEFKAEESPAAASKREKEDMEPVIGFDKAGVQRLMPRGQAREEGLNHLVKATPKDRADAAQNASALNDMSAKVRNAVASSQAVDKLSAYQKTLIQTALRGHPDDMSTRLAISMMDEAGKQYVQDVFSLREAALALPKQTTGGSRVSEPQANALFNTVPGSAGDHKFREGQLRKFDENLERLWRKVPLVEGNQRERAFPEGGGGAGGGGTIKMGGKDIPLNPDGTFDYNGHKYKPTPGSKSATLVG